MASSPLDLENLLGRALAPIEPPEHLAVRLEGTLAEIAALAAEELDSWELTALHDPRTWMRPVAAVAVGSVAAAGVSVLRARRRGRVGVANSDAAEFASDALRAITDEVERRLRGSGPTAR